jgi:flagellar basal body rod protein FlgG
MDGIHLMATAMHAAQTKLDVAAGNLANVSSEGFERTLARSSLGPGGLLTSTSRDASHGPLRHTGRAFDLAIAGAGSFAVRDPAGRVVHERSASFERTTRGELVDGRGRVLFGEEGPVVASAEATIDTDGTVRDRGRIVAHVVVSQGASLQSGFLEAPNVDGIHEMVDVLSAQRAFETAQKTLGALDEERQKEADDVARIKA